MSNYKYSMPRYFAKMDDLGTALKKANEKNAAELKEVEAVLDAEFQRIFDSGKSAQKVNESGEWTAWQRLEYLVEAGTWCPLHTIYDPVLNEEGSTAVVDGLGKISGKWAVIIASDNKQMAGAWIPGQADNIVRVTDIAKRMHLPQIGRAHV